LLDGTVNEGVVKENFKAEISQYPTLEETMDTLGNSQGFYDLLATYKEKTGLLPLYNILVGRFSKTDSYPKSVTFTLTDKLEPGKEYIAEFYLNKFLVDTVSFTAPGTSQVIQSSTTTTTSAPITVKSELGEVTFLSSTAGKTSSGSVVVKANYTAKIYNYPSVESSLPSDGAGYRGFYELSATYKEKGSSVNLYGIVVGRFKKTDVYPKEGAFTLTDRLEPNKEYTVVVNFSEYPWGSYFYNKFNIGTMDFKTAAAPLAQGKNLRENFFGNLLKTIMFWKR